VAAAEFDLTWISDAEVAEIPFTAFASKPRLARSRRG
jgi:hypothetical protein